MKHLFKNLKLLLFITLFTVFISGCSNSQNNSVETSTKETPSTQSNTQTATNVDSTQKNSGLLIGLSNGNELNENVSPMKKSPNEYRTLWISKISDKINYAEKKDEIITPYKNGFYKLVNNKFLMTDPSSGPDSTESYIYRNFTYYNNFSNIVSQVIDKPIKNLFTEETFKKTYFNQPEGLGEPFNSQRERLWYVGNNYACIITDNFATGGGTLRSAWTDCKMYDLNSLSSIDNRKNTKSLFDLLDEKEKKKLKEYPKKYNKTLSPENTLVKAEEKIDLNNIVLTRSDGRWQVSLPLYSVYEHSGNGSTGRTIKEFVPTDVNLPKSITSYDELCIDWNTIKQKFPDAKDAVSSPNKDMLAVLTPSKLLIFNNPEKGLEKPSLSIDVDKNESIILNQWSTGDYVEKWDKTLNMN